MRCLPQPCFLQDELGITDSQAETFPGTGTPNLAQPSLSHLHGFRVVNAREGDH